MKNDNGRRERSMLGNIVKTAGRVVAGGLGLALVSGCVTVTDDEGKTYTISDPLTNVIRKHVSTKWGGTRKRKKHRYEGKAVKVRSKVLGETFITTCNYLDDRNNNKIIEWDEIINPKREFPTDEQATVWIAWMRKSKGNLSYMCWNDKNKVIHAYNVPLNSRSAGGTYSAGTFGPGIKTAAVIDKSNNSRIVSVRFRVVENR